MPKTSPNSTRAPPGTTVAVLIASGVMLLVAGLSGAPRKTAPPRRTIPLHWQARRMHQKSRHIQARWSIAPAENW